MTWTIQKAGLGWRVEGRAFGRLITVVEHRSKRKAKRLARWCGAAGDVIQKVARV